MKAGLGGSRLWLLIPIAAAIVAFPMVIHGPSYGHDFNFHMLSWMEAARQFSRGTLYPHWAYSPAYNAGEPRFVFYPPASWMLGGLIGRLLERIPGISPEKVWTAAPIFFTWLCIVAAGLTMYVAARRFANNCGAICAAMLYVANPYMLFTAYERSAYAELLAAAWMPLLIAEVLSPEVMVIRIALPVALLWLTNAPAAVIGCYTIVGFVALRILATGVQKRSEAMIGVRRLGLPAGFGTVVGMGLAAFYVIPAAWERRYVQVAMATIVDMRIDHNFLFEYTGSSADAIAHDQVLRTASWVAVSLLGLAFVAVGACWIQNREERRSRVRNALPLVPVLLALAAIACLLTGWSNIVWQHVPELRFLQFPWRLLTVVAPVFAIAFSVACSRLQIRPGFLEGVAFAVCGALTFALYHAFHQAPEPAQTVSSQVRAFERYEGAEPTDEYTPETADNDSLTTGDPPYWLAAQATAAHAPDQSPGPVPMRFNVNAAKQEFLILNLRDYPAWRVWLNGKVMDERDQRDDGLIAFSIPAGHSTVNIRYVRGWDEWAGDGVSVASVLGVAAAGFRKRRAVI